HSPGAALRFSRAFRARQVGQPAFHWCGRFWHHCRFDGHHGGEHLPPYQRRRAQGPALGRAHYPRQRRGGEKPVLFHHHHGLCLLFFKRLKPARDNFLVRWLKAGYLWQLERALNHSWIAMGLFGVLLAGTIAALPFLGREFMPELEEGNLWVRGTFPINASLDE